MHRTDVLPHDCLLPGTAHSCHAAATIAVAAAVTSTAAHAVLCRAVLRAAHPDPPLTKASFVPTGASGFMPVMMARLSSHHSTCKPSRQQDAFSSCQAQLQGAHCVRSCQAAAGDRSQRVHCMSCSSADCLSWLLNQVGVSAAAVTLAVVLAVLLLLLTLPKLTLDSSSRRVASWLGRLQ